MHTTQKDTTYTKIFVGGLPYHTTDSSLRKYFEVFGDIEEAVVITDRQTGKSRGYGFVSAGTAAAAVGRNFCGGRCVGSGRVWRISLPSFLSLSLSFFLSFFFLSFFLFFPPSLLGTSERGGGRIPEKGDGGRIPSLLAQPVAP